MIKSVYISKDVEYLKYLIRKDYKSKIEVVNCSDFSFETFINLHNYTLFHDVNSIKIFIGVDDFKQEVLLPIVDKIQCDVVWAFKTLPKNYKLYKKLSKVCTINHGNDLSKDCNKSSLIKDIMEDNNLPKKYFKELKVRCPTNPSIIEQEVKKLAYSLKVFGEVKGVEDILSIYNTNKDVLDLITSLLNGDMESYYRYSKKVSSEVPLLIVNATILKKLKSLIFLSMGCIKEANNAWRSSGYFLQQDKKLANNLGYKYLIDLYLKVDKVLGNIYDERDVFTRLCCIGFYHCRSIRTL